MSNAAWNDEEQKVKDSRQIEMDPSSQLSRLQSALQQERHRILFAYLFGSSAKGMSGPLSDIDVAVYFAKRQHDSYGTLKVDLYVALSRALRMNEIDIVVLNSTSNLILLYSIVQDGIILLDSDPPFRREYETNIVHRALDFKSQRKAVMGI